MSLKICVFKNGMSLMIDENHIPKNLSLIGYGEENKEDNRREYT
jgi:hypothetical protein